MNWADFPALTSDRRGNLVAHWLQKSGSSTYAYDVRYVISTDGGSTWSIPALLNRDGKKVEHGFASWTALPKGGFGAIWLDGRQMPENSESGEMSLRYAAVSPTGRIAGETLLDSRVCECCTTTMAMTSAGPVAAYRDRTADEIRDISIVRRVNGRWTGPLSLHNDGWQINGCPVNGPQMDASGRRVAIAWFTGAGNQARVVVAFSNNAGAKFGAPIRVDGGSPMGRVDLVLLANGDALVVWMEGLGNAAQIVARRISPDGKQGPLLKVGDSSIARSSGFPRATLSGRSAYIAWTEPSNPKRIRIAKIDLQ